jgi:hypothetical protein
MELEILDHFSQIQAKAPHIIPIEVQVYEEYGISRSFGWGATTEARNKKVSDSDIDLMNRWRGFDNARGHRPRMRMQDHYSDISQMIPALLRFSQALKENSGGESRILHEFFHFFGLVLSPALL